MKNKATLILLSCFALFIGINGIFKSIDAGDLFRAIIYFLGLIFCLIAANQTLNRLQKEREMQKF